MNDSDYVEVNKTRFTFKDISSVINSFYIKVASDPLLSVPFGSIKDWPHHIERLTHFWWIRLGGKAYQDVFYNPIEKHFKSGFNDEFLERWLELFKQTAEEHLTLEQIEVWCLITKRMGDALSKNNEMMNKIHGLPAK